MADPPVYITSRNSVGIKLDDSGYTLGLGNKGVELFKSTNAPAFGTPHRVDYGLLSIDQPGASIPTLKKGGPALPNGPDVISASFLGAATDHKIDDKTTVLGYGGLNSSGQPLLGLRAEHSLSPESTVSADVQKSGSAFSYSLLYNWKKNSPDMEQDFRATLAGRDGRPSLSASYTQDQKINIGDLGYLRAQLGVAATTGPTGQFSAAASAALLKDFYTYKVYGVLPLTFEAGLKHTVSTDQKPNTSAVWQLKMPL